MSDKRLMVQGLVLVFLVLFCSVTVSGLNADRRTTFIPLTDSFVYYASFNNVSGYGETGGRVLDYSGNYDFNSTIVTEQSYNFAPGRYNLGDALVFNNVNNNFLNVSKDLFLSPNWTISSWIRYNKTNAINPFFAQLSNSSTFFLVSVGANISNKLDVFMNGTRSQSDASLLPYEWNYVVLTKQDENLSLFINGEYSQSWYGYNSSNPPKTFFTVGRSASSRLNGSVDELFVLDYAAPASLVKSFYNSYVFHSSSVFKVGFWGNHRGGGSGFVRLFDLRSVENVSNATISLSVGGLTSMINASGVNTDIIGLDHRSFKVYRLNSLGGCFDEVGVTVFCESKSFVVDR